MSEKVTRLETGYRAPINSALRLRQRLLRARAIASYNLEPCPERDAVVSDITEALRELDAGVNALAPGSQMPTPIRRVA